MRKNKQKEKQEKQWERLDSIIQRKFTSSNMNNTKWVKLLKHSSLFYPHIKTIEFKLVYSDELKRTEIEEHPEHVEEIWFREPLIYREIEWIEYPYKESKGIESLEESIRQLGKFPIYHSSTGLRIIAYE